MNDVCPLSALVLIPGTHFFPIIFALRPTLASKNTHRSSVTLLLKIILVYSPSHSVGTYSLISTFGNYSSTYMLTKMQEKTNVWQLDCGLKLCICG